MSSNEIATDAIKKISLFLENIFLEIEAKEIDITSYFMDHACFRVGSEEEYQLYVRSFSNIAELLIESKINGRNIATFKLYDPIYFRGRKLECIELPSPKAQSQYKTEWEHVEFVIDQSFEQFAAMHSNLDFDFKGATKNFNPELRLSFNKNYSIKFHHLPLEEVISIEKNSKLV